MSKAAAWRPLWIGAPQRQLYAALHPAAAPQARIGLVLAPPLLHEQPRNRRVLVEVANRLAALGIDCLRFDYFGTGDSAGSGEQHDLAGMRRDLDTAAAALRTQARVSSIAVLAWRASALAAWSWAATREDLLALALWEPVVDGAAWLAALEAADRAERMSRYGQLHDEIGDTHLMGFPVAPLWRNGIAAARLDGAAPAAPVWWLHRGDDEATLPPALQHRFELPPDAPRFDGGVGVESVAFLSRKLQSVVDEFGRALLQGDAP